MRGQPPHRVEKRKRPRWLRVLVWLFGIFLLVALLAYVVADRIFNVGSNLIYLAYRDSSEALRAQDGNGKWVTLEEISGKDMENVLVTVHSGDGFKFQRLRVKRPAVTGTQKWVGRVFDSEVNVFTFDPAAFEFRTSFLEAFEPTTASERVESEGLSFAINANFFGPDEKPLGWVVSEGNRLSPQFRKWTGFFFVKGGVPYFGPTSLLEQVEGDVSEAAQGYPSIMRDHTIFKYVDIAPDKYFDGTKITYRSLAGIRQDGTVVFIVSGDGGVMNVAEIAQIARKLRIQHATLWDGGRALQYRLKVGSFDFKFHAFNNTVELSEKNWDRVRSPVFIGVRARGY